MKLPAISKPRFVRALQRLGFSCVRQKGSHQKWKHPDGLWVYVYYHAKEDLQPGALRKILADARIEEQAFLDALR